METGDASTFNWVMNMSNNPWIPSFGSWVPNLNPSESLGHAIQTMPYAVPPETNRELTKVE